MPLKTPKRRVSDAENKLRLLCCVEALEHVTEAQLWAFVASLELMEYVPMQLLLHELLDGGELDTGTHALSGQLALSKQGQENLRLFRHRVMASDQECIAQAAPPYKSRLQQRRQVHAVYESASAGDYRVLMTLQEGEIPTLALRMATNQRETAARAVENFETAASTILLYLYGLCTQAQDEVDEGVDLSATLAEPPTVHTHSSCEHTLTANLQGEAAHWRLSLLLPTLSQAEAFGRRLCLPTVQKKAAKRLEALLCDPPKAVS